MASFPHAKPVPKSIAIFGASGHIGGPMARYIHFHAPQVRLRLLGSNDGKLESLREEHPYAEVARANYFDPASLESALAGIEGLFVLTTGMTDETPAMTNLVSAIRKSGSLVHLVRQFGLQPDMNPRRIPKAMRDYGLGLEIQHPIARRILDDAELPVTYLNCGCAFMDNFLRMAAHVQEAGELRWHDRSVTYVDPREVGEAAARLLLSDDARHLHQFYTLNNGEAPLRVSEVAQMMSEVLLRPIRHDGSRDAFLGNFRPLVEGGVMTWALPEYLWNMFEHEAAHSTIWVPNQFLERTLGRRPTTMRAWLQEHRHNFLPDDGSGGTPARAAASHPTGMAADVAAAGAAAEVAAGAAGAASAPGSTGMNGRNGIDGLWDCTVSTPVGREPHELVVRAAPDGTLSGEMKNVKNGISMPLMEGRHGGGRLTWTMQLQKPIKLKLKVDVQVSGDELAGKATAAMVGKIPIQGTRRKG